MAVINFTVEYDLLASATDSGDSGIDADIVALIGEVTFTPILADQRAVLADEYSPRPAGFKLRPFTGYLDVDGRLKAARSGTVGVRLWANDPVFDLDRLVYKVEFDVRTPIGERVRVDPGYFEAPPDDSTVNLADVLETSQLPAFTAATYIVSGTFGDGTVTFTNFDGTTIGPINIPDGALVFVDNGDGTWTAGS